jgi:hypothetical protein
MSRTAAVAEYFTLMLMRDTNPIGINILEVTNASSFGIVRRQNNPFH